MIKLQSIFNRTRFKTYSEDRYLFNKEGIFFSLSESQVREIIKLIEEAKT